MKSLYFVTLPLLLAGCVTAGEAPGAGAACNADAGQYALGQKATAAIGTALKKETGSATLRWMPPRSAATMDFRQDRLNVAYDDAMVITRVNCG